MNYEAFYELSDIEATTFLQDFLRNESSAAAALQLRCKAEGIRMDYAPDSVPLVWDFVAKHMQVDPLAPEPSAPAWIVNSDVYKRNHFQFSVDTAPMIFVAAYYFGEAVRRLSSAMQWSIGAKDLMWHNMPVVVGFSTPVELPVLMIASAQLRGIKTGDSNKDTIARAVRTWTAIVPRRSTES